MRVVLVGSASDRARLRARMNGSMTVVGEFTSLASARAALRVRSGQAGLDSDALLLASIKDEEENVASPEAFTLLPVEELDVLAVRLPNSNILALLRVPI